jgi:peptide/nickel transport system substrate-binding protein
MGWANAEATDLMKQADAELDEERRVDLMAQIGALAREDVASIPLYAKPTYMVWNTSRLGADLDFNAGQGGFSLEISKWELNGNNTLVFGAEQWPECLNPITPCTLASWLHWTALLPTMAQLVTLDPDNSYVASPLIKEIPTIENGGITEDPFSVTYNFADGAVWNDGTPITAADVEFTWQVHMETPDATVTTGYELIESVEGDGESVTITFSEPYAPWKDLFGGGSEYVLKAAAFEGNPNVTGLLADSLGWSGGAYVMESFTDSEMILVRNDAYFGPRPSIARIVFRRVEDTNTEITQIKTGELDAIFPQASEALAEFFTGVPARKIVAKGGTLYEGLWFNLDMYPVNDRSVRLALLLGLDRKKVVDELIKPLFPEAVVSACLFSVPNLAGGKWCPDDFEVDQDVEGAKQALRDGGWEEQVADGVTTGWTKGGETLEIRVATTAGNRGREDFQVALLAQAAEIGIHLRIDNSSAGVLFQTRGPARDFTVAMFAFVATPDPTITSNWGADQIPACSGCPGGP